MTRQLDLEQLLDIWLDDGPTDTADAVFDAAVARIYRQRQRPAWRVSWRDTLVTTNLKLLIAAAAVIVIAVGGIALLGRPSASMGSPSVPPSVSPPTSPSPSPTTAPSARAVFPSWWSTDNASGTAAGILPAGNWTTRSFAPGFAFTVPEGWVNSGDELGFYGLFSDTPANQAEFAASEALADAIIMGPRDSPYFVCDAWEDHRGSSAEMVASMVANEALATSEPIDVTIGGLTGKQIDVRLDPAWTERCPGDPPTADLGDGRTRGILLDAPDRGVIVIVVGSLHSADHDAFLAEAMPIVESFQFDLSN